MNREDHELINRIERLKVSMLTRIRQMQAVVTTNDLLRQQNVQLQRELSKGETVSMMRFVCRDCGHEWAEDLHLPVSIKAVANRLDAIAKAGCPMCKGTVAIKGGE